MNIIRLLLVPVVGGCWRAGTGPAGDGCLAAQGRGEGKGREAEKGLGTAPLTRGSPPRPYESRCLLPLHHSCPTQTAGSLQGRRWASMQLRSGQRRGRETPHVYESHLLSELSPNEGVTQERARCEAQKGDRPDTVPSLSEDTFLFRKEASLGP